MRGVVELPRLRPLRDGDRPEPHEIMVLRSRAGKLLALPRGESPTLGQRLVGGFTRAYFVRTGPQTQTFTATLPTADIGVDLVCDVDVELLVGDCTTLVREWTGDLSDQLSRWCRAQAAGITAEHAIRIADVAGKELAEVEKLVTMRLQSTTQRPTLPGLALRELHVRLRFANEEVVNKAGTRALDEKLKAKNTSDVIAMYRDVFGDELAKILALIGGDQEKVVEMAQRLQTEYHVNGQRRIDLFRELVDSPTIEVHIRERLAMELSKQLGSGDADVANLAKEMLSRPAIAGPADEDDD
jgi:hypothetical protein